MYAPEVLAPSHTHPLRSAHSLRSLTHPLRSTHSLLSLTHPHRSTHSSSLPLYAPHSLRSHFPHSARRWKELEALSPILEVAVALKTRHRYMRILSAPVAMAHAVMRRCEELLDMNDAETDDERPTSKESWAVWWSSKKGDVSRKGALTIMSTHIARCQSALSLALQTLQVQFPELSHPLSSGGAGGGGADNLDQPLWLGRECGNPSSGGGLEGGSRVIEESIAILEVSLAMVHIIQCSEHSY